MIIAPLVLRPLIVGITYMGSRVVAWPHRAQTMGWFITASAVSLLLGMLMVNVLQPGIDLGLPIPDADPPLTSKPLA